MNSFFRVGLASAALLASQAAGAAITFYENEGFSGRSFMTESPVRNLKRAGFSDVASSVVVARDRWEVCEDPRFEGHCVVLRPGRYPSLASMGLNNRVSSVREIDRNARIDDRRYAPMPGPEATITFYEHQGFGGRSFTTDRQMADFRRGGYNDRASSAVVSGDRWEVCEDIRYGGRCVILRPGRYPSLAAMGLNDRISSVREVNRGARIEDSRYAPLPDAPVAEQRYRRRQNERTYEASVTSVRAVVGPPEQRCWIERAEAAPPSGSNVPGALVGSILGGILGHQVGGGSGQDLATIGGAVAGGLFGANVGGGAGGRPQDIRRCENVTNRTPAFYDVTYVFRGVEHRVQTAQPPGPTITVSENGEPRA